MSAEIIPFPAHAGHLTGVVTPVVTIARYANVPRHPPYKAGAALLDGVSGWATEVLNHPGGGIGVVAFNRDEAVAWQEAVALARSNGRQAERNRRLAVATARRMVMGAAS